MARYYFASNLALRLIFWKKVTIMVSDKEERRGKKEYSLDRIKELAEWGNVMYLSSRVTRHVENLGYSPDDVHKCLSCLEEENYDKSIRYDGGPWLDIYLISYTGSTGHTENLYIKLKLNRDCIVIQLASFHPEGAI